MGTSNEYKGDIDSFAHEEGIINDESEWNIDDIIRNLSEDFIIIQDKEWNSYIDSCIYHDGIGNDNDAHYNSNPVTSDGEYSTMCTFN